SPRTPNSGSPEFGHVTLAEVGNIRLRLRGEVKASTFNLHLRYFAVSSGRVLKPIIIAPH
ncbi:MAG TPA: hypothetical protein VGJ01_20810, partial [Pseudolabrys sp.]